MSFLSNSMTLVHAESGVTIKLEPRAALRQCAHDKNATAHEPQRQQQPQQQQGKPAGKGVAASAAASVASKHPGAAAAAAAPAAGVAPARLQVAAASKWSGKSYDELVEGGVKQIDFNYDWTYSTKYKGDVMQQTAPAAAASDASAATSTSLAPAADRVQPTEEEINIAMLQVRGSSLKTIGMQRREL